MTDHLRSCVKCERHIRISEAACPFCGTAVAAERRTPPARGNPATRLRRAATLATMASVGVVGAVDLAACGSSSTAAVGPEDAAPEDAAPDNLVSVGPLYGLASAPDASDAGPDVIVGADAAYGVAQQPDAGDTGPDVVTTGDAYGLAPQTDAGDAGPVDGRAGQGASFLAIWQFLQPGR